MKTKEGFKTTEFWLTLLAQIVPVLVITGVLSNEQATSLTNSMGTLVAAVVAAVMAVWPIVEYIKGRAKVKAAAVAPDNNTEISATVNKK